MADENQIEEVAEVPVETAQEAPPPAQEPEADKAPEPEAKKPEKQPWFIGRINEETNKKHEAQEEARKAKQEAEGLKQMLEAIQKGEKPQPQSGGNQDLTALRAQWELENAIQSVRDAGFGQFEDFQTTIDTLGALNAATPEFVADVIAADRDAAHKIFDQLAKNPEKTRSLVNMSSRARIAAITRMTMAEEKPKAETPAPKPAPKISNAPAPKEGLNPVSSGETGDMGDEVSDEEFSRKWDKKYLRRA